MKSTIKNYDELPLYLNATDIANLLGVSKSTAYELMSNNEFPSIRLGGRVLEIGRASCRERVCLSV